MSSSFQCLSNLFLKALIEGTFVMLSGSLFQYLAILTEYEFSLTAVLNLWWRILLLFILVLNLMPESDVFLRNELASGSYWLCNIFHASIISPRIRLYANVGKKKISWESLSFLTPVFVLLLSFVHPLFCKYVSFYREPRLNLNIPDAF